MWKPRATFCLSIELQQPQKKIKPLSICHCSLPNVYGVSEVSAFFSVKRGVLIFEKCISVGQQRATKNFVIN